MLIGALRCRNNRQMAYSIKVQGIPRDHDQPIWSVEGMGWPVEKLKRDKRFRAVPADGEIDYVAAVSPEEAQKMQKLYSRTKPAHQQEAKMRKQLDKHLRKSAPATCWVLIIVYFWESGLG